MDEPVIQPADTEVPLRNLENLETAIQLLQSFLAEFKANQGVCREQMRQVQELGVTLPAVAPLASFTQAVSPTNLQVALEAIENAVEEKEEELNKAAVDLSATYLPVLVNAIDAAEHAETSFTERLAVIAQLRAKNLEEDAEFDTDAYHRAVEVYQKNFNALKNDILSDQTVQRALSNRAFAVPLRLRALLDAIADKADIPVTTEESDWSNTVEKLSSEPVSPTIPLKELAVYFTPQESEAPDHKRAAIHAPLMLLGTPIRDQVQQLSSREALDKLAEWFREADDQDRVNAVSKELRDIHDIVLAAATYRIVGYGQLLDNVTAALQAGLKV